jgi:hypothetical protein
MTEIKKGTTIKRRSRGTPVWYKSGLGFPVLT